MNYVRGDAVESGNDAGVIRPKSVYYGKQRSVCSPRRVVFGPLLVQLVGCHLGDTFDLFHISLKFWLYVNLEAPLPPGPISSPSITQPLIPVFP